METYPPTGTYDDLLSILARRELERNAQLLPAKPAWTRALIEPPLNLVARLLFAAARLTPPDRMLAVQDRVYRALSGGQENPFDGSSQPLARAARLTAQVRERTGQEPALACLLSHPPVLGELVYLNIELLRHSLWALRRLRGRPCRPRLVIAVDRFALDTLPLYKEAMYAGFMGLYHLGTDRLIHSRGSIGRFLMGPCSWTTVSSRLIRYLRAGGEMALVLGGGVPTTSRLLYCVREHIRRLRQSRGPGDPAAALARLKQDPGFARFFGSAEVGAALRRSAWRMMEAWAVSVLSGGESLAQADRGELSGEGRAALGAIARALGCPPQAVEAQFKAFEGEFERQTPPRERLFRLLASRVVARGRPLVLVPLVHGRDGIIRIEFREPTAVLSASRSKDGWVLRLLGSEGGDSRAQEAPLARFCRDFVSRHYE